MRRLFLAALLAVPLPLAAQTMVLPGSGGGGLTSGTTAISGGVDTSPCFADAGFLNCGDNGWSWNKTTNVLTATTFVGGLTGNATTATALAADPADCSSTQVAVGIVAAGTATCTTITAASAQFANQGTTTTVLHGNAAGNPTWAAVSISADVSGLGTGVATLLGGASSGTGGPAGTTSPTFTTPNIGIWSGTTGTNTIDDAATATTTDILTLAHTSSGSVAAGFGTKVRFSGESTTTTGRDLGTIEFSWVNATDATRYGRFLVQYPLNSTMSDAIRVENGKVSIGEGAKASSGHSVAVGNGACATNTSGSGPICLGDSSDTATSASNNAIALGYGAVAGANTLAIGGRAGGAIQPINNVYIGAGSTDTAPEAVLMRNTSASGTDVAGVNFTIAVSQGTGTGAGGDLIFQTASASTSSSTLNTLTTRMTLQDTGSIDVQRTITAAGTTGNQTINKMAGTVNIAATGTGVTVTNSLVTTSSIVYTTMRTADATCTFVKSAVPGTGSVVITVNAACGAETSIGFWVVN